MLSIDTKKKELIGNFAREGQTHTQAQVQTLDHGFPSAGQGKLMGITVDRDRFCTLTGITGHEAGIDGHDARMASTSSVWCCAYFFSTDTGSLASFLLEPACPIPEGSLCTKSRTVLSVALTGGRDRTGDVPGCGEKGLTVFLTGIALNTDYPSSICNYWS